MKLGARELAPKIRTLIENTPAFVNVELTNETRKWLSDVYSAVESSGASNELAELRLEMDSLTSYLGTPNELQEEKQSCVNKINNTLFRALSITETEILALDKKQPARVAFL